MLTTRKNVMLSMLAIIGGSGLYELDGLRIEHEHQITTPFGDPSGVIVQGRYHDQEGTVSGQTRRQSCPFAERGELSGEYIRA